MAAMKLFFILGVLALTQAASVREKIVRLDSVIKDLEHEIEDLKDETENVKRAAAVEGPSIPEVDEEDNTDDYLEKYCKKNKCIHAAGDDEIKTKYEKTVEEEDNKINIAKPEHDPIKSSTFHWKKTGSRVTVPYTLDAAISGNSQKLAAIQNAIAQYKEKACIDWVPVSETSDPSQHHVRFINGGGCYSYIGNVKGFIQEEGYQPISIGNGCGYVGTVIHEMLHCMGFFHEQSRPDRDDYVKVFLENLENPNFANNFKKQNAASVDTQGIDYDIKSVMHYGPTYFAKQGTSTILKRVTKGSEDTTTFSPNREGFSDSDLKQLNSMYDCAAAPATEAPQTEAPETEAPQTEAPQTEAPQTEAPTEAPPPPTPDFSCEVVAKLGLCRYKGVCQACNRECTEGTATEQKGLIVDVYNDAEKCKGWVENGLCEGSYKVWMNAYCLKSCLDKDYPDNGFVCEKQPEEPQLTCNYVTGDGVGGSEERAGDMTDAACAQTCWDKRNAAGDNDNDSKINGATIRTDGGPGCWCEYNMNGVNGNTNYKTCKFADNE